MNAERELVRGSIQEELPNLLSRSFHAFQLSTRRQSMFRLLLASTIIALSLAAPAHAQELDDARALARLYAGAKYFLLKAEPDKARRYAQSMYLLLNEKEARYGAEYADRIFYGATGINGSRRAFFRSMDVIERDGSLSLIPSEPEKKSYTCRNQYDGSVSCAEN